MALEYAVPLEALVDRAVNAFRGTYGREPSVVVAAPGRVNLIGEHTDYNDGYVLPMAIERYTVVAVDAAQHDAVRLESATMGDTATLGLKQRADLAEQPGWAKYAQGVLDALREAGFVLKPMEGVIDSTVPLGGGLSSSAALEVSLMTAIEAVSALAITAQEKALLAQKAEHKAGMPCGVMDQFSSALCEAGNLMLLDCRSLERQSVPLADPNISVLIINSNVKHELTGGEYAERRAQCEEAAKLLGVASLREASLDQLAAWEPSAPPVVFRRARHVVGEIARTTQAAQALAEGDYASVGQLMYESHAAMRDDFEITVPEIDTLVELAREIGLEGGVYGSRMTGGGFGGCTVSLVRTADAEGIAKSIAEGYTAQTGQRSTQFITRPAQGARRL
ncbi:galactokinase [Botrimarina hoheduenensis]|uniref:Galactokinase n=1 Tax=Botrimarina hoheduenensis TaxID=2528000 RepID=A0A5C5VT12_9BACT|nr:galactokinase [Botrimarina hoheduenensis]TWT41420.1 Galactokinase [Botrimarina hoheduenensis]